MKTEVFSPTDATVASLVESYTHVESEKAEIRTIPNGRVDASIILDGSLEWFFEKRMRFEVLSPATFYPPTRTGSRARWSYLKCIAVKFYPHILALPAFESIKMQGPLSFDVLFKKLSHQELITELKENESRAHQTKVLDRYFLKQFFSSAAPDSWIQKVARALESGSSEQPKIGAIAEAMGISIKTLERRFQKTVGLTPKVFSAIIQLHQATKNIRKKGTTLSHGDLAVALGSGYYDQSHFIKSCQRITGLTPRKLFTKLPDQVTDVVIVEG